MFGGSGFCKWAFERFKSFPLPVIPSPFILYLSVCSVRCLRQIGAFSLPWTPGFLWQKCFTSFTYCLSIKTLCFHSFCSKLCHRWEMCLLSQAQKLTHRNEGLSQCINWAFAPTLTFDLCTQCGIQLSCSLKWKPSEPSTKIFHSE